MSAVEMTPSPETAPLLGRRKAASAWPRRALAGVCAVAGCVALAAAAKHGALGGAASVASQKLGQSLGYTEDGKPQSANEFVHDECVKIYGDTTEGGVSPCARENTEGDAIPTSTPSAPGDPTPDADQSDGSADAAAVQR